MAKDIELVAHLMRRAGFGASNEELEARTSKGYEATVEELLDPDSYGVPVVDTRLLYRYHPMSEVPRNSPQGQIALMYHLITTERPLEEKMALFWHMVFATGDSKVDNPNEMLRQMAMFRDMGRGSFHELLLAVAKDPAMIYWLDNNQNHRGSPNENWGRELLELFSMGQGHYSEEDVKAAAQAFTGWTVKPKLPRTPHGRFLWEFEYLAQDHDESEKTFLGQQGRFNGEDIIDIIVRQPATAQFIARHLYNFFVADEVQVPSWLDIPPIDAKAVDAIAEVFITSGLDLKATLRFLFNSSFFKDENVWFAKVKNPVEVVVGISRLTGEFLKPKVGIMSLALEAGHQGQEITNPPSVEGWHTGAEWIDTGALVRRVNFVADRLGDIRKPGTRAIVERLKAKGINSSEALVDGCLEELGFMRMEPDTRQELIRHAESEGIWEPQTPYSENQISNMLQLIGTTREYQFC